MTIIITITIACMAFMAAGASADDCGRRHRSAQEETSQWIRLLAVETGDGWRVHMVEWPYTCYIHNAIHMLYT